MIKASEELKSASARPNPVNIAGYGRESTHKGYLSWMLTSRKSPIADKLIHKLLIEDRYYSGHNSCMEGSCSCEQSIGNRRKIDLMVELLLPKEHIGPKHVPIELKTDSGPSGERQFSNMTEALGPQINNQYFTPIVFCLGSSSVQDHCWGDFRRITPERLNETWSEFHENGKSFFKDWMNALRMEIARKELAHEVYRCWKDSPTDDVLRAYGYRGQKHLFYYVYYLFRDHLKKNNGPGTWTIYDGGYNAVMYRWSHDATVQSSTHWNDIAGFKDELQWYFEFNDDRLCLKICNKCNDHERVKDWAESCTQELLELKKSSFDNRMRPKSKSSWKKQWLLLCDWDLSFRDFGILAKEVDRILGSYGTNGLMGKFSDQEQ